MGGQGWEVSVGEVHAANSLDFCVGLRSFEGVTQHS